MSNRSLITDSLVTSLKEINGSTSSFDSSYKFNVNLYSNVYRGLKFIDEINDYPCIYVTSPLETREYNTRGTTIAKVDTQLRCYIYGEDTEQQEQDLIDDVEHVIENLTFTTDLQVLDIKIDTIIRDNGIFKPYGLIEIFLNNRFELIGY